MLFLLFKAIFTAKAQRRKGAKDAKKGEGIRWAMEINAEHCKLAFVTIESFALILFSFASFAPLR
jgi:hypothetical protein